MRAVNKFPFVTEVYGLVFFLMRALRKITLSSIIKMCIFWDVECPMSTLLTSYGRSLPFVNFATSLVFYNCFPTYSCTCSRYSSLDGSSGGASIH